MSWRNFRSLSRKSCEKQKGMHSPLRQHLAGAVHSTNYSLSLSRPLQLLELSDLKSSVVRGSPSGDIVEEVEHGSKVTHFTALCWVGYSFVGFYAILITLF